MFEDAQGILKRQGRAKIRSTQVDLIFVPARARGEWPCKRTDVRSHVRSHVRSLVHTYVRMYVHSHACRSHTRSYPRSCHSSLHVREITKIFLGDFKKANIYIYMCVICYLSSISSCISYIACISYNCNVFFAFYHVLYRLSLIRYIFYIFISYISVSLYLNISIPQCSYIPTSISLYLFLNNTFWKSFNAWAGL